jgi:hypothetical protein
MIPLLMMKSFSENFDARHQLPRIAKTTLGPGLTLGPGFLKGIARYSGLAHP